MNQHTQQTTTIKELSEVAGVSELTIRRAVEDIYPGLIQNGRKTELNFDQAEAVMHNVRLKGGVQTVPIQNEQVQNLPSNPLILAKQQIEAMLKMVVAIEETQQKQAQQEKRILQLESKIETKFTDEFQEQLVTPTELGQMFTPKLTAQQINKLLQDKGLQYKVGKSWVSSVSGNPLSYNEPIQKEGVGMVYQLKWKRRVRELLV